MLIRIPGVVVRSFSWLVLTCLCNWILDWKWIVETLCKNILQSKLEKSWETNFFICKNIGIEYHRHDKYYFITFEFSFVDVYRIRKYPTTSLIFSSSCAKTNFLVATSIFSFCKVEKSLKLFLLHCNLIFLL